MDKRIDESAQLSAWQAQLPDDLTVGRFEDSYIDLNTRQHYQYGAWNTAGEPWLMWNTDSEFQEQPQALEIEDTDETGS